MIKILFFTIDNKIGGTEQMMLSLASALPREEFSVALLTVKPYGVLHRLADDYGVASHSLRIKGRMTGFLSPFRLFRFLLVQRPDILQTMLFLPNVLGRLLGRAAGIPSVVGGQRSTDPWRGRHHQVVDRLSALLGSLVVSNSEAGRRMLVEKAGLVPERVVVISNGVPPAPDIDRERARERLGIGRDQLLVGSVGSLREPKGYHYLLPAFREVLAVFPNARLVIVGEGAQKKSLVGFSRRLGISGAVEFPGFRKELSPFYAALDLFVLPSLWEGLPVSLLEAMSFGLPVVTTLVSGIPEAVVDGREGFLVEPANPQQLAERIIRLLKDEEMRVAMGMRGKERVARDFSREKMVREYRVLYRRLAGGLQ